MNRDCPGIPNRRGRWLKLLASAVLALLAMPRVLGAQAAQGTASTAASNAWMNEPPASTGIAVGQKIPAFQASDQNGKTQDLSSITGPKGAVLYFMRSADW
jgi:hypothetical protein